jgi:hypothetical protein
MESSRQAQNIQRTINTVVGRRLVRCVAPFRLIWPRDVSEPRTRLPATRRINSSQAKQFSRRPFVRRRVWFGFGLGPHVRSVQSVAVAVFAKTRHVMVRDIACNLD